MSTVGFLCLYTHFIFSCLDWQNNVSFFFDFFVSGGRCWNLGVFHEYLSLFGLQTDQNYLSKHPKDSYLYAEDKSFLDPSSHSDK